jgi:hypothetical protein
MEALGGRGGIAPTHSAGQLYFTYISDEFSDRYNLLDYVRETLEFHSFTT